MYLPSITPALWPILQAAVIVFSGFVLKFVVKLYGVRRRMMKLQSQGLVSEPKGVFLSCYL